jgi:hypothetical protein
MHNTSEHVVDLGELLIDEKDAFTAGHDRDQRRQLRLLEDIGHCISSKLHTQRGALRRLAFR